MDNPKSQHIGISKNIFKNNLKWRDYISHPITWSLPDQAELDGTLQDIKHDSSLDAKKPRNTDSDILLSSPLHSC